MANNHQSPRCLTVIGTYIFRDVRCQKLDSNLHETTLNLFFTDIKAMNAWPSIRIKWKSLFIMFKIIRKMRRAMILSVEDQTGSHCKRWSWGRFWFYKQSMWPVIGETSSVAAYWTAVMDKLKWAIFMLAILISCIEERRKIFVNKLKKL